jgi:hypothetical protein
MQRSTSAIQGPLLGVITACPSSRREPEMRLMAARAAAIWSLVRRSQLWSSNGAPESSATLVSLST